MCSSIKSNVFAIHHGCRLQIQECIHDFRNLNQPVSWTEFFQDFVVVVGMHRCVHHTRRDGVGPNAVGHEFHRKGLAHAIGALERLGDNTWLVVVGSDNPAPYKRLTRTARDRLIFAGPRSDLPALYSAADAFVLPTAYETFSLVCMEAMACALPVFATPVGGIEDYLRNGVNGFQIGMDAEDIARKIADAFDDPALMSRMRDGARATAQAYSWDQIGLRYIELLKQINETRRDVPARPDSPPNETALRLGMPSR